VNIPTFTAEASAYKSVGYYSLGESHSPNFAIIPQLSSGGGGSIFYAGCFRNCISRCSAGTYSQECVVDCDRICTLNPTVVFFRGGIAKI
jgi:hypothetical protein